MAITITHPFVSLKGDGGDATLVRPSNWNAAHTTSMATLKLLGRLTAGAGAFEELPTTAYMIAALNSADAAAFLAAIGFGAFETGDVKFSISPTAAAGWLAYNGEGTIGKAGSGATILAAATAQPLYEIIYNNVLDASCPVSGGRTGNAVNDFNSGKTIALPRFSGRSVIGAGTGSGLTARLNGAYAGVENQGLVANDLPAHSHPNSLTDLGHSHTIPFAFNGISSGTTTTNCTSPGSTATSNNATGITITNANNVTTATAHNNMQPYIPLWAKVKL